MNDSTTQPLDPTMGGILDLERLDEDLYRAHYVCPSANPAGTAALYGGQIAAEALKAAGLTVGDDRFMHSLHGYFLRAGRQEIPVEFRVHRDSDGRSFSARRVEAIQDGKVIFALSASFHIDEPGAEVTTEMPSGAPDPDSCPPRIFSGHIPRADVRLIEPFDTTESGELLSNRFWMRSTDSLGDDRRVHACALTYMSDIGTGFFVNDVPGLPRGGSSLDHSLWLTGKAQADQWILVDLYPLMAGGARGLYGGSMHHQDGTLIAMLTQQALMRPPK